jgi:hypothetical protein
MEGMAGDIFALCVEGDEVSGQSQGELPPPGDSVGSPKPQKETKFNSNEQPAPRGRPKSATLSVKIVLADMKLGPLNKPVFTPTDVAYCEVTEDTANAPFISSFVKQHFGSNYVLTSNDGLEIKDFSGTRGLKFWKHTHRKFYAIAEDQIPSLRGKKRASPPVTASPASHASEDIIKEASFPDVLLSKMSKIDKSLQDLQVAIWTRKCPMKMIEPIRVSITSTFRCKICHTTPLRPPIVVGKCCSNILGCQRCVDIWFSQGTRATRSCPLCNKGGKSETFILKGIDEFLDDIRPIMEEPQE